jgi:hypothetical protein
MVAYKVSSVLKCPLDMIALNSASDADLVAVALESQAIRNQFVEVRQKCISEGLAGLLEFPAYITEHLRVEDPKIDPKRRKQRL